MRNPRWLLAVPVTTYLLSYIYLAFYHGKVWLWNTVVHESGSLTLFQTAFYASHFLGHVPALTFIAVLFCGWFKVLSNAAVGSRFSWRWLVYSALFVLVCMLYSFWQFGTEDTLSYLLLQRQSVERLELGGSFLLHLPSTLTLALLIPFFLVSSHWFFQHGVNWNSRHLRSIAIASGAVLFLAWIVSDSLAAVIHALSDPRYLAHSVRELATFPLTFFPIPLAFWLLNEKPVVKATGRNVILPLSLLALFAVPLLAAQVRIPLTVGIGELAQKPAFADGELSVSYLLSSHYFEHVLDTLYFTAICFAIIPPGGGYRGYSSSPNKTKSTSFLVNA